METHMLYWIVPLHSEDVSKMYEILIEFKTHKYFPEIKIKETVCYVNQV